MTVSPVDLSLTAERLPRRSVGRAGRFVLVLAALAQLFGVVAGPLEHWRTNSRLGAHIEASGSSQGHYAHNEATCVACAIGHMAASPMRRAAESPLSLAEVTAPGGIAQFAPYRVPHSKSAPRAPPCQSRIG